MTFFLEKRGTSLLFGAVLKETAILKVKEVIANKGIT